MGSTTRGTVQELLLTPAEFDGLVAAVEALEAQHPDHGPWADYDHAWINNCQRAQRALRKARQWVGVQRTDRERSRS